MSFFSSYKKIFMLGFIMVILVTIPFSVYIAQKRQNISSKAIKSTTLSFEPASTTAKTGDTVTLNIWLDPGTGTTANQISFVKLAINFDKTKFTASSLTENIMEKIDEPQYDNTAGKASISLSIGADPANAIKTKTKIAILKLKATAETTPANPNITFDFANSQVLSIDNSSQTSDNVLLSSTIPATVTITSATSTNAPTSTPTSTPTPTSTLPNAKPGGSSGSSGIPSSSPLAPVCSSLDINGLAAGTAPYSLTFTATGNDPNGTINKISFNFGDAIEDLTIGGGIGTSSVSGQILHTYKAPGIYTAYAILTDNANNLSAQQSSCTKTVTVNSTDLSGSPIVTTPLPPPGDGEVMFGLGALGIIFTIIGGVLLFL